MSLLTLFQKNVTPVTYGIWNTNEVPSLLDNNDAQQIVVGTRFQSSSAGTITGIRWYKSGTAAGTHTVSLWTNAGSLLASKVVTGETSTGWQEMLFTTPVTISANTDYIASFHTTDNLYQATTSYTFPHANSPLTASNSLYSYSTTNIVPGTNGGTANYWIDVVFKETTVLTHATTGVLIGQSSSIVGTAAHKAKHTTTGVLTGQSSSIVGTAVHKARHTTTGVLTGQGRTIVGSAAHKAKHITTGALIGQASSIVSAARRFITHVTSGALTGQGSTVVGSASRATGGSTHVTTGALAGQASSIAGTAAHKLKHVTTGVLTGQSTIIAGSSEHKIKHATNGALVGLGSIIAGIATNGTSVITRRFGVAYWNPVEKEEPIPEEEDAESWTEPDLFEKLRETRANHEAIVRKAQQIELMDAQQKIRLRKAQDDQIIEMYLRNKR